jgi:PHD/YefM family antitoxin component YafN of YafNO toxin-antitoxin module
VRRGRRQGTVTAKQRKKKPEIVIRDGKPAAVIIDIVEYKDMLERLEDAEDLETLKEMRKRPLEFTTLDDFLAGRTKNA